MLLKIGMGIRKPEFGNEFTTIICMRIQVAWFHQFQSASGNSGGGPSCPGPLKLDGTPDMRYAENKAAYGSQMSRQSSGYSSVSSYYSSVGHSISVWPSNQSFASSPLSFSCGPLKKDGTPDMRFKANRR